MSYKNILIKIALLSLVLFIGNSYANDKYSSSPTGPYIVGEVGAGFVSVSELTGVNDYLNKGTTASPSRKMGAQLNERIAIGDYLSHPDSVTAVGIEVGYNYFNQIHSSANGTVAGHAIHGTQTSRTWSTTVEGIANFDIANRTSFFTKLGLGYANINRNVILSGNLNTVDTGSDSDSGVGISGGMGFQFLLAPHIAFRVEADGLVGKKHLGYVQGLAGLVVLFQA